MNIRPILSSNLYEIEPTEASTDGQKQGSSSQQENEKKQPTSLKVISSETNQDMESVNLLDLLAKKSSSWTLIALAQKVSTQQIISKHVLSKFKNKTSLREDKFLGKI